MLAGPASFARWLPRLGAPVLDGALAGVLVVGTWVWEALEPGKGRPADAVSMALTALVNGPLAVRRRAPFTVLVISAGVALVYHLLGYHLGQNSIGPLLALYTVAAHASWRASAAGMVLVVGEWTHASAGQPGVALWSALGQSVIVAVAAVSAGSIVRLLGERGRQLAALAAQLAREQDAAAARAVTRERVRIARELHDVVAHHMSVISVQAGLGRYVALSDPATARTTLGVIADTSHEALTEMRRLLSILRIEAHDDEEGSYSTTPRLSDLEALVERVRAAGPSVRLTVEGGVREVPPGLDLCAYRIVQESLTNVLKHAGPAHVDVHLAYAPDALTLRVTDDGAKTGPVTGPDTGHETGPAGHGLIGMTERVRLYQGTITTGRRPQGGYEVEVTFPL